MKVLKYLTKVGPVEWKTHTNTRFEWVGEVSTAQSPKHLISWSRNMLTQNLGKSIIATKPRARLFQKQTQASLNGVTSAPVKLQKLMPRLQNNLPASAMQPSCDYRLTWLSLQNKLGTPKAKSFRLAIRLEIQRSSSTVIGGLKRLTNMWPASFARIIAPWGRCLNMGRQQVRRIGQLSIYGNDLVLRGHIILMYP